jgi:hypothetical protein
VQRKRLDRIDHTIDQESLEHPGDRNEWLPAATLRNLVVDKDNTQQVCEDILDVLASYYKVARKRFIDAICIEVVGHFFLDGEQSPLRVFPPDLVMYLKDEQLEAIAGEDTETKNHRAMLEAEIKNLEAAAKLLRM